jgi:starvation-inducible outer membrane lipoprotein
MKRLVVVAVMVALATAAPVMAQESVVATGTMERLDITSYQYGSHAITDEASGTFYVLNSDVVDLDAYDGQRVTVYGTLVPGYESGQVEGGPPLVYVTEVVPAPL